MLVPLPIAKARIRLTAFFFDSMSFVLAWITLNHPFNYAAMGLSFRGTSNDTLNPSSEPDFYVCANVLSFSLFAVYVRLLHFLSLMLLLLK